MKPHAHLYEAPSRNWRMLVGKQKVISNVIRSTRNGIEWLVFPADDNRRQENRESHDRSCSSRSQSQDDC
jgi:hypothetical protein